MSWIASVVNTSVPAFALSEEKTALSRQIAADAATHAVGEASCNGNRYSLTRLQ